MLILNTSYAAILKIKVTSFNRTSQEQAKLLIEDRKAGKNIKIIYKNKDLITKVSNEIDKKNDSVLEDVTKIIKDAMKEGIYLSKHLCGKAIDLSKREGAKKFISFMKNDKSLQVIEEVDHYHLQFKSECNEEK